MGDSLQLWQWYYQRIGISMRWWYLSFMTDAMLLLKCKTKAEKKNKQKKAISPLKLVFIDGWKWKA